MTHDSVYVKEISDLLYQASRSIRILRNIAWPVGIKEAFLASGGTVMPTVEYPKYDPTNTHEALKKLKSRLRGDDAFDQWAMRTATILGTSARLLSSMGTPDFYQYSRELYSSPGDPLPDGMSTSLDLARQFEHLYGHIEQLELGSPYDACLLAHVVAERMTEAVQEMFGEDAPEVALDDEIASNAIAGRQRIRIRRTACFTDNDVDQLIHHEAYVHVATSLNGYAQHQLKILRAGHPGTTKTQEGLAVFAELITGSLDLDRLRRLSDRIIAIQMAIDGADFIELYRYFLEKTDSQEQAFENARRVVRGGVLTGGAPFTKDMVYLDGLLRVHNFMRIMVTEGRFDYLELLFCGKLDMEDIPLLLQLREQGLVDKPRFLPPWMQDRRFLLSYLAYSSFLNSIDLSKVREHYRAMLS